MREGGTRKPIGEKAGPLSWASRPGFHDPLADKASIRVDVVDGDHVEATLATPYEPDEQQPDRPHPSGGDRLAVYVIGKEISPPTARKGGRLFESRQRLAETSLAGLGACLLTLADEGQIPERHRVGVFDRETRKWIINPWAGTSPWIPTGDG